MDLDDINVHLSQNPVPPNSYRTKEDSVSINSTIAEKRVLQKEYACLSSRLDTLNQSLSQQIDFIERSVREEFKVDLVIIIDSSDYQLKVCKAHIGHHTYVCVAWEPGESRWVLLCRPKARLASPSNGEIYKHNCKPTSKSTLCKIQQALQHAEEMAGVPVVPVVEDVYTPSEISVTEDLFHFFPKGKILDEWRPYYEEWDISTLGCLYETYDEETLLCVSTPGSGHSFTHVFNLSTPGGIAALAKSDREVEYAAFSSTLLPTVLKEIENGEHHEHENS